MASDWNKGDALHKDLPKKFKGWEGFIWFFHFDSP
jgi:hypothetical protein